MTPTNQPQDCNHVWGKEACTKCGKSRFYQPPAETEPGKSVELEEMLKRASCDIDQIIVQTIFKPLTEKVSQRKADLTWGVTTEAAKQAREIVRVQLKAAIELLIEERIAEAAKENRRLGARKALNHLQMHIPTRFVSPVKDSPMELSRDGEVFNAVIQKVNSEISLTWKRFVELPKPLKEDTE